MNVLQRLLGEFVQRGGVAARRPPERQRPPDAREND
jgi:hypothetical protein